MRHDKPHRPQSGHEHPHSPRGGRHHAPRDTSSPRAPRGRIRHGDVRAALLLALSEGPAHGYELGQRLLRLSDGAWQPSPGSIYPTLQSLSDEELVTSEEREQRRIYTLTRRGTAEVKARADRGEALPWKSSHDAGDGELRDAVAALKMAAKQVSTVGNAAQRARATEIVVEARRKLYELLATS